MSLFTHSDSIGSDAVLQDMARKYTVVTLDRLFNGHMKRYQIFVLVRMLLLGFQQKQQSI